MKILVTWMTGGVEHADGGLPPEPAHGAEMGGTMNACSSPDWSRLVDPPSESTGEQLPEVVPQSVLLDGKIHYVIDFFPLNGDEPKPILPYLGGGTSINPSYFGPAISVTPGCCTFSPKVLTIISSIGAVRVPATDHTSPIAKRDFGFCEMEIFTKSGGINSQQFQLNNSFYTFLHSTLSSFYCVELVDGGSD